MLDTSSLLTKFRSYLLTEQCVSKNTYASYHYDLEQFEKFLVESNVSIEQCTKETLKLFLQHLYEKHISARSVARKIATLRSLFGYLEVRFGLVNISKDIHLPKMKKRLPQFLSLSEVDLLFKVTQELTGRYAARNKIMILLLYVSGMRVTELAELRLASLEQHAGLIKITGKGGKQRLVPIPTEFFSLIVQYINHDRARYLTRHGTVFSSEYLFPIFYKNMFIPISRQACWNVLNQIWRQTGINRSVSPHQLRHSLATHLLARGVDLRSLQLILGHENLETVQIYTHVDSSFLREAYDKKHPRS